MTHRLTTIFAMILAISIAAENAQAQTQQLSCTGVKIEPPTLAQSPVTLKLTPISSRKVTINLDNRDINSPVISDNRIALRFRTKDFVGELFRYTNDLFLVYHSGHLAKLTCTPG
jgi:hypothetical protein